jgi:hypothetical protein
MNSEMRRARQFDGTYDFAMEILDSCSPASKIVHQELDVFFAKVRQRLTEASPEATAAQINADIKSALAFRFGNPVAKSCMPLSKGPNAWNDFQRDNYKRKADELQEVDGKESLRKHFDRLGLPPNKAQVVQALSMDWRTLPETTRKEYQVGIPRSGNQGAGKQIPERDEIWRKRRIALWERLKTIVAPVVLSFTNDLVRRDESCLCCTYLHDLLREGDWILSGALSWLGNRRQPHVSVSQTTPT